MENFVRGDLKEIIDVTEYRMYFGIYYKKVDKNKIGGGERSILWEVANYFKKSSTAAKQLLKPVQRKVNSANPTSSRY